MGTQKRLLLSPQKQIFKPMDYKKISMVTDLTLKRCFSGPVVTCLVSGVNLHLFSYCMNANSKGLQISGHNQKYFFHSSTETYVVGTQKNRLSETVLLSTHNTCLDLPIRKYWQFYEKKISLSESISQHDEKHVLFKARAVSQIFLIKLKQHKF